jgi:hypothetical protein
MGLAINMVDSHSLVIGTIILNKAALAECPALVECLAMVDLNLGFGIDLNFNLDIGVNLFLNPDTGHSLMWSTTHQSKMAQVVQKKVRLLVMVLASLKIGLVDLGALRKEMLEFLV